LLAIAMLQAQMNRLWDRYREQAHSYRCCVHPKTSLLCKIGFIPFGFVSECVQIPARYICKGLRPNRDTDQIQPHV